MKGVLLIMGIPREELHQLIDKLKEEQVKKMLVMAKGLFEETKKKKTKWPGSSLFRHGSVKFIMEG